MPPDRFTEEQVRRAETAELGTKVKRSADGISDAILQVAASRTGAE